MSASASSASGPAGVGVSAAALERAALISVWASLGLSILKAGAAVLSGSIGLAAEAVHSAADTLASGAVLAGLRLSRRKSPAFPYGLYKVENLVALGVSWLIFAAAYEIAREAALSKPRAVSHIVPSAGALAAAALLTVVLARYKMRIGVAANSPSLQADAQHSWADVLSSAAVIVGLIGTWFGLPLDRFAAAVVVVFIVRVGWGAMTDAVRVLLDASVDRPTLDLVRSIIEDEHAVQEISELVGRNSGRYRFLEVSLVLRAKDLEKAARIAAHIEHRIREQVRNVDHVDVRYEPYRKEIWRYVVPLADREGAVSAHFGDAPLFALLDVRGRDRHLVETTVVENPYAAADREKGIRVAEFLIQNGMDYLVLRDRPQGRGPEYVLRDAGVEVEMTEKERLEEVLREVGIEGALPEPKADSRQATQGTADEQPPSALAADTGQSKGEM